ncbi:MAG: cytochrome c [Gemmatimonadales bacterium]
MLKPHEIAGVIVIPVALIALLAAYHPAAAVKHGDALTWAAPDGKELYLKNCKQCHGVRGEPTKQAVRDDKKIPKLTDPEFYKKHTDKQLAESIAKGKGRNMKAMGGKLSAEEIDAIVKYIHTFAHPSP